MSCQHGHQQDRPPHLPPGDGVMTVLMTVLTTHPKAPRAPILYARGCAVACLRGAQLLRGNFVRQYDGGIFELGQSTAAALEFEEVFASGASAVMRIAG